MEYIRRFFAPPVFEDEEKTRTAELVNTILISLAILSLLALAGVLLGGREQVPQLIAVIVLFVLMLVLQIPLRRGYVRPVSMTIVVLLSLSLYLTLPTNGTIREPVVTVFIFIAIIAGLTVGRKTAYWVTALNIAFIFGMVYGELNGLLPEPVNQVSIQHPVMFSVAAIMSVILIDQALRRIQAGTDQLAELNVELEQRVAERTKALATSTEVSRRLSTINQENELVKAVVEQVQDAFGYYHAHIYLAEGDDLVMAGGTGEAGEKMLASGHKLPKGSGLVGRAAENNEPVLVADTSQDPDWLPNPLLPETKSEVAIPISFGEKVQGVLDVQHNVPDGLSQDDVDSLLSIANQVAIALQNAESYARAEQALQEAQVLVDYAAEGIAILDLETELWAEPNENFAKMFGMTREEMAQTGPKVMSPPTQPDGRDSVEKAIEMINTAMEKGSHRFEWVHTTKQGTEFDCEIGLVRMPGDRPRLRQSIMDITERKRLQEQVAQRARQQEALNTITQKIQNTTTIEKAMQIAARELGHALGKRQTLVALEPSALNGNRPSADLERSEQE